MHSKCNWYKKNNHHWSLNLQRVPEKSPEEKTHSLTHQPCQWQYFKCQHCILLLIKACRDKEAIAYNGTLISKEGMCKAIAIWIKIIWLSVSSWGRTAVHLERFWLQKFGKHCNKVSVQNVKDWGQTENAEDINKETVEINERITSNAQSKLLTQHDNKIRSATHLGCHIWSAV